METVKNGKYILITTIEKMKNTINNCVKIEHVSSGLCLDSKYTEYAKCYTVYATECNGGNTQNWKFNNLQLINCETKLCLESRTVLVSDNEEVVPAASTHSCDESKSQTWINA